MAAFKPCQGKTSCRDDGEHCLTCGRSLEEIVWLRELLEQLASLATVHEYENVGAYAEYVARKIPKRVAHHLERANETARNTRESVRAD